MSGPGEFGPYRLLERLGRGGCGEVWKAVDSRTGGEVALKRLIVTDDVRDDMRTRFRREVELTRRLNSAHVVPIHDAGEIDGELYLDMRLVAGGDLHRRASAAHRPDPTWAARIVGQIAHALDAAHRAGMVHRDVKPANVLVDDVAGEDFCYLADFGIARLIDESADRLTVSGDLLGTLPYMAPELFRSSRNASPSSDGYALGCVLYELLTGRRAFSAPNDQGVMHLHLEWMPAPPSTVAPVQPAFDAVLARALAKRPEDRFPGVGDLAAAALEAADAGPTVPGGAGTPGRAAALPPSTGPRPPSRTRGRRTTLVAAVVALVLVGVGTTAVVVTNGGPAPVLGPRPAALDVAGVDACTLFSQASRDRLDLSDPSPAVETVDPDGPARCFWTRRPLIAAGLRIPDLSQSWTTRVYPDRTAQDVLAATADPRVLDVSGYSAVAGPVDDESEDTACRLTVDVSPTASVAVDYVTSLANDDAPIGRDAACDLARQAAVEVVGTLRSTA